MAETRNHVRHFQAAAAQNGVAQAIESTYNGMRNQAFRESARGALTLALSSFGKGVLAVAALAVAGGALIVGGMAAGGGLDVIKQIIPGTFETVGKVSVTEGLLGGAKIGFAAVTSGFGAAVALGAGVANALTHWNDERRERAQAMQQAEMRSATKELQAATRTPQLEAARHAGIAGAPGQEAQEETIERGEHFGFSGDVQQALDHMEWLAAEENRRRQSERNNERER